MSCQKERHLTKTEHLSPIGESVSHLASFVLGDGEAIVASSASLTSDRIVGVIPSRKHGISLAALEIYGRNRAPC